LSGNHSRLKGARGELEVQELFRARSFACTRGFASGASGGGDLAGDLPDHVEIKRAEQARLYAWIDQVTESIASGVVTAAVGQAFRWVIFHRPSRREWTVTMPAERYLELISKERELDRSEV
jgi:Holliday junction resolvase